MKIQSYRELIAWQKARVLVKEVYLATRTFPREEQFGLTSQMRRAAVSVPSNIAEGQARNTTGEFVQFLGQAKGSLAELETQIILSQDLELLPPNTPVLPQAEEVNRVLSGLIRSLQN